jgi:hypothetical protein
MAFCDLRDAKESRYIESNYDLGDQMDELYAVQVKKVKDGNRGVLKVKDYNFDEIKKGLELGLDRVKGFCGEIKLKAR